MATSVSYLDLPSQYVALEELVDLYPETSRDDWKVLALCAGVDIQRIRVRVQGYSAKYFDCIEWEDVTKIEEQFRSSPAKDGDIPAWKFARELGVEVSTLMTVARESGVQHYIFDFGNHVKAIGFGREARAALEAIIVKGKTFEEEDCYKSFESVVRELNTSRPKLRKILKDLEISMKEVKFGEKRGLWLSKDQVETLSNYLNSLGIKPPQNGEVSVKRAARIRKMREETLVELAKGANVKPANRLVRGIAAPHLSEDQLTEIKKAYDSESFKELVPISIRAYAKSQRVKPEVIVELAEGAGITLRTYNFGSRKNLGITSSEISQIKECYKGFPEVELSDEDTVSLSQLADEEGIHIQTLHKLLVGTDIEVKPYRFPNGRNALALKRDQVNELKNAYGIGGIGDR